MRACKLDPARPSPNPPVPSRPPSSEAGLRPLRFAVATAAVLATGSPAWLGACATYEVAPAGPSEPPPAPVPESDSGAPLDAAPPCTVDCEYYLETCSEDVLCPNGLVDSTKPVAEPGQLDPRTRIHLVRGRSPSDVWALGSLGTLAHFDGTSWRPSQLPVAVESPLGRLPTIAALWLRDGYEVGVGGLDRVFARNYVDPGVDAGASVDGWTDHGAPTMASAPGYNIRQQRLMFGWGAPGAEWLWLATMRTSAGSNMGGLARLRVTPSKTFEGNVAKTHSVTFAGMHGASAEEVWAVGMNGVAMRVTNADGDSPSFKLYDSQTRNALYGVWAASESDAWAVGFAGTIRHYVGDPAVWEPVADIPTTAQLNAVWGSSSSDVWAVGNDAIVLHYDGTRWSRMKIGGLGSRRPDLTTVWTAGPGHVWVGGDGVLLSLGGKP
ncbi:MAG: hypothetical protein BGO98_25720 [Myxococcales bacterium 68-20]|nr:hypothetical protein [Myxococcales bacterium]OJY16046.1 MAG: hypothetical protein BGO98_25720 [Myxococcales bacterium 68-20]